MWVTLDLVTFYHKFNTICCETMPKERSRVCLRNNSCQLCQYKRHFIISTISTVCVSLASTAICHHKAPKTINWATTMTYMTSWKKYIYKCMAEMYMWMFNEETFILTWGFVFWIRFNRGPHKTPQWSWHATETTDASANRRWASWTSSQ